MTRKPLVHRMLGDSALYGISAAVAKAIALVTVPYLTRALTPEGYGVADLATSTAALLTLLVLFAGDIPAARDHGTAAEPGQQHRVLSSYVWTTIVAGILVALLLAPAAGLLAGSAWGLEGETSLALATLVLVPVSGAQAALAQTQRIRQRAVVFAVLSFIDLLAQLGFAVVLVALGLGPAGVVIGFILGSAVGLVAAAIAARDTLCVPPSIAVARRLVTRGLPFLPHVTLFVIADWVVRTIVANAVGPTGVAELALAVRIASVLTLVGAAFALAWGPIGLARTASPETADLFGNVLVAFGTASLAVATILACLGPELLPIIAGPRYTGAALILPGFAIAYAVAGTEYVLVVAAGISNRGPRVAAATSTGATVQVLVATIMVPMIGILAIGPAAILGRIVSFGILLTAVRDSMTVQVFRLIGIGGVAIAAGIGIEAMAALDSSSWRARWVIAIAVAVVAGRHVGQRLRSRATGAA